MLSRQKHLRFLLFERAQTDCRSLDVLEFLNFDRGHSVLEIGLGAAPREAWSDLNVWPSCELSSLIDHMPQRNAFHSICIDGILRSRFRSPVKQNIVTTFDRSEFAWYNVPCRTGVFWLSGVISRASAKRFLLRVPGTFLFACFLTPDLFFCRTFSFFLKVLFDSVFNNKDGDVFCNQSVTVH